MDQGEAVTELLTKDASVDVYVLSSADDQTFRTLRDRGYLREIESEALQSFVSGLYPQLQREVTVDGKICGVPVSMFVQDAGMSVNLAAWEKLGLKREELPGSWRELMRFILERWPQMQADAEAKGVCLASYPGNIGEHFLWARESQCPEPGRAGLCHAGHDLLLRRLFAERVAGALSRGRFYGRGALSACNMGSAGDGRLCSASADDG